MERYKKSRKRMATILICALLAGSVATVSVPAAVGEKTVENEIGGGQLCHFGHENCAYVEAVEGHPCKYGDEEYSDYIRDEDEPETETVLNCRHVHDAGCYKEGVATPYDAAELDCRHVHTDDCYEVSETETATASNGTENAGNTDGRKPHVHDEDCGYVEEVKGVRCSHPCEICDEIYGELPQWSFRSVKTADTGDFVLTDMDDTIAVRYNSLMKMLQLKGHGSVTVSMKGEEASRNGDGLRIWPFDGDLTVNLNGVEIETDGDYSVSPVEIYKTSSSPYKANVNLVAGTENILSAVGDRNRCAAMEVGNGAILVIGADGGATGSLEATAQRGAAIGSAYNDSNTSDLITTGDITIANGTVTANGGRTGIGGAGTNSAGNITITGGAAVNVNSMGGTGIGCDSGQAGTITVTGSAVVDVKSPEGTGIGCNEGTTGPITISDSANVTIDAKTTGIGTAGYTAGETGAITISDSAVKIQFEEKAGIGSYTGTAGDIAICNSEVAITGGSYAKNLGVGIGSGYGEMGAITVEGSTLSLDNCNKGIYTLTESAGTGEIKLTETTADIKNCTRSLGCYNGKIEIFGGSLDIEGGDQDSGISISGTTEGAIDLNGGCTVNLNMQNGMIVEENNTLNVGDSKLVYRYTEYDGVGITGHGSVNFLDKSQVDIISSGTSGRGIDMDGTASSVVFQQGSVVTITGKEEAVILDGNREAVCMDVQAGSRVRLHNNSGSSFGEAVKCPTGILKINSGADIIMTVDGNHPYVIDSETRVEGDTCILVIASENGLAGKNLEIRDENGAVLTPEIRYSQQEAYTGLALKLPQPGKYTVYVDGKLQEYRDKHHETQTVMDVAKGINSPGTIKGEGNPPANIPMTGIQFVKRFASLELGNESFTRVVFVPADATNRNMTVSSSDESIVHAWVKSPADGTVWMEGKAEGTVDITVTTADGGFKATCMVTVSKMAVGNKYHVIVAGSSLDKSGAGKYARGETVTVHAGNWSGYKFTEWICTDAAVKFADKHSPDTTFVMPDHDVTVVANWQKTSSTTPDKPGSSGSGGSDGGNAVDTVTKQYTGGGTGSSATWNHREDGTWTATVGGETPKANWICLSNPYAGAGQPKGGWFYFDENGTMKNGWFNDKDGKRYYLEVSPNGIQGMMQVGWRWIDGKRYYFGSGYSGETLGALVTGGKTADGYEVNAAGEWIVDGVVQTQ